MNTDLITEHLDLWTSAVTYNNGKGRGNNGKPELTGIQKLRELILELAVRGKLVPQDPKDEPASKLLERIEGEKARLYKEGKVKKPKKLPEITEEEKPFKLPESWRWTRLGYSTTYGDAEKAEPGSVSSDTWVLELEDIEKSTSRIVQRHFGSERNFKSSKNKFWKGDVLYGKLRPYLDKVLVAPENGVCTTEIIPFRGFSNLSSSYLRWTLKAPYFKDYATNSTHGMSLPRLGTEKAQKALIPLPPVNEQERIVEKVNELMALCDRLEQQTSDQISAHETLVDTLLDTLTRSQDAAELADNWTRLAEHFDTLFTTEHSIDRLEQTILQLAVMGRLVQQDPNEEPASKLLERIWAEKKRLEKEGKIKKGGKPSEVGKEELSGPIPEGWVAIRFEELAQEISTGPFGSMLHKSDYVQNGVPLVNPSHMVDGKIVEDSNAAIKKEKLEELEGYFLYAGDMVMARRGEVGRCALVTEKENGWICGTGSFILRFHQDISRRYIHFLFQTYEVRAYLAGESVGTTMTNLNHRILKKMPVMLPPAAEQERIVEKITELRALCNRLKDQLVKAGETQRKLAESIVKRAVA